MTVKEAINELKYSRDMCYFDPSTGETGKPYSEECERMAQALDIAIEALESEPAGDCINRQAAIDFFKNVPYIKEHPNLGALIDEWINQIPTVQPEQKTGRWSKQMLFDDGYGGKKVGYICSACRKYVPFKGNYCGNCGAKMESEDQNDT